MGKLNDLTGRKFGRLNVSHRGNTLTLKSGQKVTQWWCWCDCEVNLPEDKRTMLLVRGGNLTSGNSKSCGCLNREKASLNMKKAQKVSIEASRRNDRVGEQVINFQGYLMTVIEYNNASDITVQFEDYFKAKVKTTWDHFYNRKTVKNPYHTTVCNVGRVGNKYPIMLDYEVKTKEYETWKNMLYRCFDYDTKQRNPTYRDVTCCEEWLLYENFYEWLHKQPNFIKWLNEDGWHLDKDILVKGNKIYSPDTCSLVPYNVNVLFCKADAIRGEYPIGVTYSKRDDVYHAKVNNPLTNEVGHLIGSYKTTDKAFDAYKKEKERIVKEVAEIEFNKNNITKKCYDAMLNYQVEIDD